VKTGLENLSFKKCHKKGPQSQLAKNIHQGIRSWSPVHLKIYSFYAITVVEPRYDARSQIPHAFWSAGGHQERLWGTAEILRFCYCEQTIKKIIFFALPQSLFRRPPADQGD